MGQRISKVPIICKVLQINKVLKGMILNNKNMRKIFIVYFENILRIENIYSKM
jgi:hypothetical protein